MQTSTQGMTKAQANAARSTCTACHQRKVKCDAHDCGYPCTRCRKSGAADDCRLHRKNKRVSRARQQSIQARVTQGPKPLSPAVLPPVEESIVVAEARTPADTPATTPAATPGSLLLQTVFASGEASTEDRGDQQPRTPNDPYDPHGSDAGTAGSTTTASTPAVLPSHGADGEYKKYLVEFIDQPQLAERPIDKTARILYVGSELSNIHFLLRQRMAANSSPSSPSEARRVRVSTSEARTKANEARTQRDDGVVHYPTNRIAKPSVGINASAADGLPLEAFQLPPKRAVDQLLAAYFRHINPGFPVVDERLFMRQYRARDPQNPPSLLLLQAILVAGAHVYYRDSEERVEHKGVFFRRAKMLLDARFERNRDTVVQAALLLTWHADGPEDVAANAWHWVGLAARTATGLGMHRDADGSTLVPHNKRMWRRVWWLLVSCDVLVALQYGRPPALHLDDTDVKVLRASDFVDCGEGTRVDYVLHLTQLCILLSTDVLRRQFQRSPTSVAGRRATLRRTDEALANWSLHLPPSLQLSGNSNSAINVWTASLHLTYNTALLLLHRQAPSASESYGPTADDVEICTNAAVAVQQIFHAVCASGQAVHLWSSAINSLFTALIQLSGDIQRSTSSSSDLSTSNDRSATGRASGRLITKSTDTTDTLDVPGGTSSMSEIGNPLLAVAALRRYDAALASLRQLAAYWPNAQSVVQFFEQSVRLTTNVTNAEGGGTITAARGNSGGNGTLTTEGSDNNGMYDSNSSTAVDTGDATLISYPVLADITERNLTKDLPQYNPVDTLPDIHMDMDVVDRTLQAHDDPDMAHHLLSNLVSATRQMLPFDGSHPHPHLANTWNTTGAGNTDWQRIYWQQPELTDDFLFSF